MVRWKTPVKLLLAQLRSQGSCNKPVISIRPPTCYRKLINFNSWEQCNEMVMWSWVNIGSDNGLLPDGTRPWSEPMMTYHHWDKFYRKCLKWRKMKPLTLCTGLNVLDWMSSQYHDHFCYYAASPWCIFLLLYVVSGFVCGCPAVL